MFLKLDKSVQFFTISWGLWGFSFILENVQSYSQNYFYSNPSPYQTHLETGYLLVYCNEFSEADLGLLQHPRWSAL